MAGSARGPNPMAFGQMSRFRSAGTEMSVLRSVLPKPLSRYLQTKSEQTGASHGRATMVRRERYGNTTTALRCDEAQPRKAVKPSTAVFTLGIYMRETSYRTCPRCAYVRSGQSLLGRPLKRESNVSLAR